MVACKPTGRLYTAFRLLESLDELLTHSQRTGFTQHFASWKVWTSYSPTVNGQALHSISPPRKSGRVTHSQSTDRVYTAFHLLESMGESLTQSSDRVYTAFHLLESVGESLTHSHRTGFIQIQIQNTSHRSLNR